MKNMKKKIKFYEYNARWNSCPEAKVRDFLHICFTVLLIGLANIYNRLKFF